LSFTLFIIQTLNGLQLGVLLFLMAAGLTLVFGIMNFVYDGRLLCRFSL
jgi:branched-chain amino acid transport system permease protein